MTTSEFWDKVLEPNENLLWSGRPAPTFHLRNWRLYGSAPMAALGLFSAAWLIIATTGSEGDIWLLVLPALLVAIPVRSTLQQIRVYGATRYALTNRRVLFFRIEGDETRVKAHPHSAICAPDVINTFPPSVSFLRYGKDPKSTLGFEYIKNSEILVHHLEQREEW